MFKELPTTGGGAIGTLVAVVACLSAVSASANTPLLHPGARDQDLSARVAAMAASINKKAPPLLREVVRPEMRVAQWRN